MLRFLRHFIIFLLLLVAADALGLLALLKLSSVYPDPVAEEVRKIPESEILFFGSSHAEESFVPGIIESETGASAWNLGGRERNPLLVRAMTRTLLKERSFVPKLVVITVTYDDLREHTRPHLLAGLSKEGLLRQFQLFYQMKPKFALRGFFFSDYYSSSWRYVFSRAFRHAMTGKADVGWKASASKGHFSSSDVLEPGERPETIPTRPYVYYRRNLHALEQTLRSWQEAGVRLVITDPPEFAGTRLGHGEYDLYRKRMEELADQYGAEFHSFNRVDDFTGKAEYFRDGGWGVPNSHMNQKGSSMFSRKFAQWLKENNLL